MQAGAKPYPMLPYMGVLFTAIGDNLAQFMQGQEESAEQAAGRRHAGLRDRREGSRLPAVAQTAGGPCAPLPDRAGGAAPMPHRTFIAFIAPSLFVMLLFIALPILSVAYQSLFVEHEQVLITVENCGPVRFAPRRCASTPPPWPMRARREPHGAVQRARHLRQTRATSPSTRWRRSGAAAPASSRRCRAYSTCRSTPRWRSPSPTRSSSTPLVIVLGFFVALGVNAIPRLIKGPVIFFSLLPMIVTPLVGSLVLFWMIDARRRDRRQPPGAVQRPAALAEGLADADLGHAVLLRRLAHDAVQLHRLLRRAPDRGPATRSSRR